MSNTLVDFTVTPQGNLLITLLPEGMDAIEEMIEEHGSDYLGSDACFRELIEHQLCNGWTEVSPEDIGALTSGIILSDNVETNDDGKIVDIGRVYWDSQYAVQSAARELYEGGKVEFVGRT
jgi:hypothetical protein